KFTLPIFEVIKDLYSYKKWIKVIKEERNNPNSKFNKFGLNANYFYILYVPISLPQEDSQLPDSIKRLRVVEMLAPIHQYLDNDLGFADYIIPEFNQFYDDNNNPTLTYGIVYRFAFKRLSIKWVITRLLFIIALIFLLYKFGII
ncbi:MAG TPA: hypothetical protein P5513_04675, partial [Candidatus Diapherotrites archaeon]|nr:hypothetical protein [Candidatus Diapherotrites archaeon]